MQGGKEMPGKPTYDELAERVRELESELAKRNEPSPEERGGDELLRKNESYFRELVDNSPTGISIIQDEEVVFRNPEQQKIFGPLEKGCNPPMSDKVHPGDRDKLIDMYRSTLSGHASNTGVEIRFIHLSGETTGELAMKYLHCRSNLIEYQGRKAVLVNMVDMTKAREIERLMSIQDRMISLGHVASGIAHEIRNPLSGINIYLDTAEQVLQKSADKKQLQEIIEKIQSASSKIESVIKRVMDFSKPSEPKLIKININRPIEDALALSSVMLRKTGVEITRDLTPDLPPCIADFQLVEQVMLNLVMNAAEAMKEMEHGKKIMVNTSLKEGRIFVSVADSGPGVPSDLTQKIFDPFFTTKKSSTGIGLSLCQRIAHDHGGILTVSSSKLGGAEFSFTLPVSS